MVVWNRGKKNQKRMRKNSILLLFREGKKGEKRKERKERKESFRK